ncbi:MAG: exodeoxyribonuclease III [Myxococcaceae bacterium]
MKLTTWNVNGVRARESQVADWLRLEKPDVLCLQEIKASLHQVPPSLLEPEGFWAHWHGEGGYSGVSMIVSRALCPVRPKFWSPAFDHECRVLVASLGGLDLATFYVPNGGKDFDAKLRFLTALERWVDERLAAGRDLVLCGDFNVAREEVDVHEKLRDSKQTGQTEGERALFGKVLAQGLTDLGRKFAPDDTNLFTWWAPWRNYRERNIGWRLDLVLTSSKPTEQAKRCTALREFGSSDHGPVTAVFEGPLFDPTKVDEGSKQELASPEKKKAGGPQLDLF